MNIYLDIDGVLLANDKQPARHAAELIKDLVENHDVSWLTMWCRDGDTELILTHLPRFFPAETREYIRRIKPTRWQTWKTEAIDWGEDFRWLDDQVFDEELQVLEEKGVREKLVMIDLAADPDQLEKLIPLN